MAPVGIQMFATITSKDHAQNIQQDLQNIYFTDSYRDTILQVRNINLKSKDKANTT